MSAFGHLIDTLTFRTLGTWIIVHEVTSGAPQWESLVAGFACFFMPDAIRGKDSPVLRAIARVLSAWIGQPEEK